MKLVKLFSILGLVVMASACGSSQPTSTAGYNAYGVPGYGYNTLPPGSTVLIGGITQVQGNYLQRSAFVNAGEKIIVNTTGVVYNVTSATCGSSWYNTIQLYNPPGGAALTPLSNIQVTFNGQVVNGSLVTPTTGTVVLTATLDPSPFNIRCTALYDNQLANITGYNVNLMSAVTK